MKDFGICTYVHALSQVDTVTEPHLPPDEHHK
jgi:hypothetical protein